jgi:hypothetical protein
LLDGCVTARSNGAAREEIHTRRGILPTALAVGDDAALTIVEVLLIKNRA